MVNESTEFEEKSATRCKELEHYLKSLKETTEQLSKVYQTLSASQSVVCFHPAAHPSTQDRKNPQVASGAKQLTLKVWDFLVLRPNAQHQNMSALLSMCVVSQFCPCAGMLPGVSPDLTVHNLIGPS